MIVRGDVDACGALGLLLQRAAAGTGDAAARLAAARTATGSWTGAAADRWRTAEAAQSAAADDLARALLAAGSALTAFAAALADAQDLAARATAQAVAAGLVLDGLGGVAPVPVPYGPFAVPEQEQAARRAAQQVEARTDVLRTVAAAREAERLAHEQLLRDLRALDGGRHVAGPVGAPRGPHLPPPGWTDLLDLAHGLVLVPGEAYDRATAVARARGDLARQLKVAARSGTPAERALARKEWRAALRDLRAARAAAASHALAHTRLHPVSGWLRTADGPLAQRLGMARSVPLVSLALAGVGTGLDVRGGMAPTTAVVKNAAGTGAGIAAGSFATGLAATAMTGGAVAAAPVLVGVAAGAVVGYGVGWVVGEYGEDAWDGIGHICSGATDLTGRVWGRLTG